MNVLTRWRRAPRTLRSQVLRLILPRTAAFLTLAAVLLVGNAIAVNPTSATFERLPSTYPTWSAAQQAAEPGCVPAAEWPEGTPADEVVVHRFADDVTERVAFLAAWDANHDLTEVNDVWVLGVCP